MSFVSGFPSETAVGGHILESLVETGGELQLQKKQTANVYILLP